MRPTITGICLAATAALMGGCSAVSTASDPSDDEIRRIGGGQHGGLPNALHTIIESPGEIGDDYSYAIKPVDGDEKMVVVHAGQYADARYTMSVSVATNANAVTLDCQVNEAPSHGQAFAQVIVRPWRAYAVPDAASIRVNDCQPSSSRSGMGS